MNFWSKSNQFIHSFLKSDKKHNFYNKQEILEVYPNKFIKLNEGRTYVFDTLFNLPES